jgi:hypothetical protein
MDNAIQQIKNLIQYHDNQLKEHIEFYKSDRFVAGSVEGATEFAIKNATKIYTDLIKELNEAISILEKQNGGSTKTKLFKIRNKETGEFSKGGHNSERFIWTKGGKTWTNIGHVKNHLRAFMYGNRLRGDYPYNNAEIVEIEVDYTECNTVNVNDFINEVMIND